MHPLDQYNSNRFINSHLCNVCRVHVPKNSTQYRCQKCDFDVCEKCMTMYLFFIFRPPQNRKYCPKMHGLRFGIAPNYMIRSCDKCQKRFGLEKGYTCLNCDYDLCKACY